MSATRRLPAKPPAWACEPLIACLDGPLEGQWFTAADWQTRVTAAARMQECGQRRQPALDYALATTATVPHPAYPGVRGTAARYRPAAVRAVPAA